MVTSLASRPHGTGVKTWVPRSLCLPLDFVHVVLAQAPQDSEEHTLQCNASTGEMPIAGIGLAQKHVCGYLMIVQCRQCLCWVIQIWQLHGNPNPGSQKSRSSSACTCRGSRTVTGRRRSSASAEIWSRLFLATTLIAHSSRCS
jgi:hypothetical protein